MFELPERRDVGRYIVSGAAYRNEESVRTEPRAEPPARSKSAGSKSNVGKSSKSDAPRRRDTA